MTVATEQRALVIQDGQTLKIEKIPVPSLTPDQDILIKVGAPATLFLIDSLGRRGSAESHRLEALEIQARRPWKSCWM